jgi:hypothetical protein
MTEHLRQSIVPISLPFAELGTDQHSYFDYRNFATNTDTALDFDSSFGSASTSYGFLSHSQSHAAPSPISSSSSQILTTPANTPENNEHLESYPPEFLQLVHYASLNQLPDTEEQLHNNRFDSLSINAQSVASTYCASPSFDYYDQYHPASASSSSRESSPGSNFPLLRHPFQDFTTSTHSPPSSNEQAQGSNFPHEFSFPFDSELRRNQYPSPVLRQSQSPMDSDTDRNENYIGGTLSPPYITSYKNQQRDRYSLSGSSPDSSSSSLEDSRIFSSYLSDFDFDSISLSNDFVSQTIL